MKSREVIEAKSEDYPKEIKLMLEVMLDTRELLNKSEKKKSDKKDPKKKKGTFMDSLKKAAVNAASG